MAFQCDYVQHIAIEQIITHFLGGVEQVAEDNLPSEENGALIRFNV